MEKSELSAEQLTGVSGGVQGVENDFYDPVECYKKTHINTPCEYYHSSKPKCVYWNVTKPFSELTLHYTCQKGFFNIMLDSSPEHKG